MHERFTDPARKVMQLANQEAQRFNHEYIGTEHVLLGLLMEGTGTAIHVLLSLDIDLRKIRLETEKIVQTGPELDGIYPARWLPQTPPTKKVIEYAISEARNLNHNYVGSEHLLLGLVRETDGIAAQVLLNLGVSSKNARDELAKLLGQNVLPAPPSAPEVAKPLPADGAIPDDLPPKLVRAIQALDVVIGQLRSDKDEAVAEQDFEEAARLRDRADTLHQARRLVIDGWKETRPGESAGS
jgi:hypothetical protein